MGRHHRGKRRLDWISSDELLHKQAGDACEGDGFQDRVLPALRERFFGLAERRSFETQLRFTQSVNLMTLMASRDVLEALHELNTSYQSSSAESQWKILDKILYCMRRDMIGPTDTVELGYSFPVIVTSLPPTKESSPNTNSDARGGDRFGTSV